MASIGIGQLLGQPSSSSPPRSRSSSPSRAASRSRSTSSSTSAYKTLIGDEILIMLVVPPVLAGAGLVPAPHRRRHRRAGGGRERRPGAAARHPDQAPLHDRVDGRRRPGRPHLHAQGAVLRRHARPGHRRARGAAPRAGRRGGRPHGVAADRLRRRRRASASWSRSSRWNTSGNPTLQNVLFLVVILAALLLQRGKLSRAQESARCVLVGHRGAQADPRRARAAARGGVGASASCSWRSSLAVRHRPEHLRPQQPVPRRGRRSSGR